MKSCQAVLLTKMENDNNCPICLESFKEKTQASPDACDHVFCLPCLEKWSKLGSYCPVDRKRFKKILNLNSDDVIQIKPRKRKKTRTVYDFTTLCETCKNNDQPNVLLLCDCCDLGYHTYCLSPPLNEVPSGLWFCPTCSSIEEKLKKKNGITKEIEADMGHTSSELLLKGKTNKKRLDDRSKSKNKTRKPQKLECSNKNNSVLEACRDTIAEFEHINIEQKDDKDLCCSKIFDSTFSEIDKISKSFSFSSESSGEQSKQLKTYSIRKTPNRSTKRTDLKPPDTLRRSQRKTKTPYMPDMYLIQDDESSDIDLTDYCSTESMHSGTVNSDSFHCNEVVLNETKRQAFNEEDDQNEFCPKTNYLHSENLYQSGVEDISEMGTKNKKYHPEVCKGSTVKNLSERSAATRESVVTTYNNDSGPESNFDQSGKGTFNNLIYENLKNNNNEKQMEEKARFSVFQKIENSSQNIYSQFITTVDTLFPTNLYTQHCCICKDEIFVMPQDGWHCKICKLKYFKKPVRYEKYSQFMKNSKNVDKCLRNASNAYPGSGTLNNQKVIQKKNSSALERRKHSLIRTLQKIQNSK